MLQQSVAPEHNLADINAGTHLPPLNNLPQWSRVNTLDKARYPKPFLKDRLQRLPVPDSAGSKHSMESGESQGSGAGGMAGGVTFEDQDMQDTANPTQRITHLERSVLFLQHQHQEVLTSLHAEIDNLKRENKDLQFKIIMLSQRNSPTDITSPPGSGGKRTRSSAKASSGKSRIPTKTSDAAKLDMEKIKREDSANNEEVVKYDDDETNHLSPDIADIQSQGTEDKLDELKIIFLEEELKELKKSLREEKNKNVYLTQLLEQAQSNLKKEEERLSEGKSAPSGAKTQQPAASSGQLVTSGGQVLLPFNATTSPLLVHLPTQPERAPTVTECETIIKHLLRVNDKQSHELSQLKSDLRDVLYSHKWTPDAYLLAKAYVVEDDAREAAEKERLPRIELKHQTRKLPDSVYNPRDTVTLPALKQTMGNKAIERRKRTQILQKARMRREIIGQSAEVEANN